MVNNTKNPSLVHPLRVGWGIVVTGRVGQGYCNTKAGGTWDGGHGRTGASLGVLGTSTGKAAVATLLTELHISDSNEIEAV